MHREKTWGEILAESSTSPAKGESPTTKVAADADQPTHKARAVDADHLAGEASIDGVDRLVGEAREEAAKGSLVDAPHSAKGNEVPRSEENKVVSSSPSAAQAEPPSGKCYFQN